MGQIRQHRPVFLIAAVTSRYPDAFEWAMDQTEQNWGPIWKKSQMFQFEETSYYEKTMGSGLTKQFWVYDQLLNPEQLANLKITSNELEESFAKSGSWDVERPLNIDPGYLTEAKLVLATTKDRDHRLFLANGIYAEVTLYFHRGQWQKRPWTYPDYQRADFQEFFTECRNELRSRYRLANTAELDERDFQ